MVKQLSITEQTFSRWRKEYGGMRVDQAKRLKEPEAELADVIRFMSHTETPDRALIRAIVKNMEVRRRRAIEDFCFFDRPYFSQLESLVAPELDALGIPRYF